MLKTTLFNSCFRTMRRNKVRSFFMMISIVLGVGSLTFALSVARGMETTIMAAVNKLFTPVDIVIAAGGGGVLSGSSARAQVTTLTMQDLQVLQETLPGVRGLDPSVTAPSREVKSMERSLTANVVGHSDQAGVVWSRGVTSGESITSEDVRASARIALLGPKAARTLFPDEDPVGQQIRIGGVPFTVKGVLEPLGVDPHGMDRDEEIHVPLSTAMRRLLNIDYVMGAKIRFADANAAKQAPGAITRLLRERHHLQDGEPDDFSLLTPVMVQEKVSSMGRVFSLYIPLLSLVCLVIGGIVIVNIMLITVGERKSEIGLRKAVGARAKDILTQFLFETAALTLSGGVLGSLLGFLGVLGISLVLKNRIDVSWTAAVLGLFGSAAIGVLAGLLPARRAAALQPAEALR